MTDWREHNGGPQPVDDETWVVAPTSDMWAPEVRRAKSIPWLYTTGRYRILNDHLIDAARLEGIRLGLEAANKAVEWLYGESGMTERQEALEDASMAVRALNPDTIAREAVLDQLTREAQAQDMGYDND